MHNEYLDSTAIKHSEILDCFPLCLEHLSVDDFNACSPFKWSYLYVFKCLKYKMRIRRTFLGSSFLRFVLRCFSS
jgi:hypothetical protein